MPVTTPACCISSAKLAYVERRAIDEDHAAVPGNTDARSARHSTHRLASRPNLRLHIIVDRGWHVAMRDDQVQILPYFPQRRGSLTTVRPQTPIYGHVAVGIVHLRRHAGGQTTTCRSIQVKTPTRRVSSILKPLLKPSPTGRSECQGGWRKPRATRRDQGLPEPGRSSNRTRVWFIGTMPRPRRSCRRCFGRRVRAIDRRVPVDGPEYPPDALARQWRACHGLKLCWRPVGGNRRRSLVCLLRRRTVHRSGGWPGKRERGLAADLWRLVKSATRPR